MMPKTRAVTPASSALLTTGYMSAPPMTAPRNCSMPKYLAAEKPMITGKKNMQVWPMLYRKT